MKLVKNTDMSLGLVALLSIANLPVWKVILECWTACIM